MNTTSIPTTSLAHAQGELDSVIQSLLTGQRDPEATRRACEEMDRLREELRQRVGTVDLAADLIREGREEE